MTAAERLRQFVSSFFHAQWSGQGELRRLIAAVETEAFEKGHHAGQVELYDIGDGDEESAND